MFRTESSIIFITVFAVYLLTMSPSLPAYRDAGEMATSAYILGVSHPPSYPLYILMGHMVQQLPLGNPAWRLTLLSAVASAGAVTLLFEIALAMLGMGPALVAVVLMATNVTFWYVAIVPEMYSLMLLQGLLLLALALWLHRAFDARVWYGFIFLYGLSIGNRTDLLLWAPGLFWLTQSRSPMRRPDAPIGVSGLTQSRGTSFWKWIFYSFLFGTLGLSIYLYLPLRSSQGPWLDWNHPAELSRFIGSLTRRGYGGTLDLLSKSYAPGSMFFANLEVYAKHLWKDYLGLAIPLVPLGIFACWRREQKVCIGWLLMYVFSGPVFLYMANMPPNPHAMAIVEPHYLLSDLMVALWAAEGLAWLASTVWSWFPTAASLAVAFGPILFGLGFLARGELLSRVNHRWNLFDYDYCHNVLRSLPRDAVLIAKKDVQLFSLWYFQTVEKVRPDVHLVAQGLSASPWYQNSRRKHGETSYLGPLKDETDWKQFAALNGPKTYAAPDAEFPAGLELGPPQGLAVSLSTAVVVDSIPWVFMVRRGEYEYERQPEFFDSDLIEAYANARQRLGNYYLRNQKWGEAVRQLYRAWTMHWFLPDVPNLLGYVYYSTGRLPEALHAYEWAVDLYGKTLDLTRQYRSLEGVVEGTRHAQADALVNGGVVLEKLGKREESVKRYRRAIALDPNFAQAHYNLAVLYWNRDWAIVAAEMSEVLRIDPSRKDAAQFLARARYELARTQH